MGYRMLPFSSPIKRQSVRESTAKLSTCYKRVQSFRVHCLFAGQNYTENYITFANVIYWSILHLGLHYIYRCRLPPTTTTPQTCQIYIQAIVSQQLNVIVNLTCNNPTQNNLLPTDPIPTIPVLNNHATALIRPYLDHNTYLT